MSHSIRLLLILGLINSLAAGEARASFMGFGKKKEKVGYEVGPTNPDWEDKNFNAWTYQCVGERLGPKNLDLVRHIKVTELKMKTFRNFWVPDHAYNASTGDLEIKIRVAGDWTPRHTEYDMGMTKKDVCESELMNITIEDILKQGHRNQARRSPSSHQAQKGGKNAWDGLGVVDADVSSGAKVSGGRNKLVTDTVVGMADSDTDTGSVSANGGQTTADESRALANPVRDEDIERATQSAQLSAAKSEKLRIVADTTRDSGAQARAQQADEAAQKDAQSIEELKNKQLDQRVQAGAADAKRKLEEAKRVFNTLANRPDINVSSPEFVATRKAVVDAQALYDQKVAELKARPGVKLTEDAPPSVSGGSSSPSATKGPVIRAEVLNNPAFSNLKTAGELYKIGLDLGEDGGSKPKEDFDAEVQAEYSDRLAQLEALKTKYAAAQSSTGSDKLAKVSAVVEEIKKSSAEIKGVKLVAKDNGIALEDTVLRRATRTPASPGTASETSKSTGPIPAGDQEAAAKIALNQSLTATQFESAEGAVKSKESDLKTKDNARKVAAEEFQFVDESMGTHAAAQSKDWKFWNSKQYNDAQTNKEAYIKLVQSQEVALHAALDLQREKVKAAKIKALVMTGANENDVEAGEARRTFIEEANKLEGSYELWAKKDAELTEQHAQYERFHNGLYRNSFNLPIIGPKATETYFSNISKGGKEYIVKGLKDTPASWDQYAKEAPATLSGAVATAKAAMWVGSKQALVKIAPMALKVGRIAKLGTGWTIALAAVPLPSSDGGAAVINMETVKIKRGILEEVTLTDDEKKALGVDTDALAQKIASAARAAAGS